MQGPLSGVSPDSLLATDLREDNDWTHLQTGLSLRHELGEGARLSAGVDYLYYDNANPIAYALAFRPLEGGMALRQNTLASTKDSPFGIVVGKVDYVRPVGGGELSAGLKVVTADFENDVTLRRDGDVDARFTTASTLDETIGAAYAQYRGSGGDFEYQVGLRYEYTDTHLEEAAAGAVVDRDYGSLFPNVSLGYRLSEEVKVTGGYARRINRPAFTQLAPFVDSTAGPLPHCVVDRARASGATPRSSRRSRTTSSWPSRAGG